MGGPLGPVVEVGLPSVLEGGQLGLGEPDPAGNAIVRPPLEVAAPVAGHGQGDDLADPGRHLGTEPHRRAHLLDGIADMRAVQHAVERPDQGPALLGQREGAALGPVAAGDGVVQGGLGFAQLARRQLPQSAHGE